MNEQALKNLALQLAVALAVSVAAAVAYELTKLEVGFNLRAFAAVVGIRVLQAVGQAVLTFLTQRGFSVDGKNEEV